MQLSKKKPKQKKAPEPAAEEENKEWVDFMKCDFRVGRITDCWAHPDSEKLYCEKIDIGEGTPRSIGSGLQLDVPLDGMTGLVVVFANLKPKKLAGYESHGMVMCGHPGDERSFIIRPHPDSKIGERLRVQGQDLNLPDAYEDDLNPKKKVLERVAKESRKGDNL